MFLPKTKYTEPCAYIISFRAPTRSTLSQQTKHISRIAFTIRKVNRKTPNIHIQKAVF